MKSNTQKHPVNYVNTIHSGEDDWDDDVRTARDQPEIESFYSSATVFPVAGAPELASFHGVDSKGRYKLIIAGRRALVTGNRFIVVDRDRNGKTQPWRTYNHSTPGEISNEFSPLISAICEETGQRYQFSGAPYFGRSEQQTHAPKLHDEDIAVSPALPIPTVTVAVVGPSTMAAENTVQAPIAIAPAPLRAKGKRRSESQQHRGALTNPNKATAYLQKLEKAMKERAAGIEPIVDTAFVEGYFDISRSTVTRSLADRSLPTPSKLRGKNQWKLSDIECAREAMLTGDDAPQSAAADKMASKVSQLKMRKAEPK